MERREFITLSLLAGSAIFLPSFSYTKELDLSHINFSSSLYQKNQAQTIIVFMYGGASQLAGNLTNIEEIKKASQNSYEYFRELTPTTNNCWKEAGGTHMEELLANGDMSLFRTCFSQVREEEENKAHGRCTSQNQRGSFEDESAGIISNLAEILASNALINQDTVMPFVTLEGESIFYREGETPLASYLKPVGINEELENPYSRDSRIWFYYNEEERDSEHYNEADSQGGFDPILNTTMDNLAQENNQEGKIKEAFKKRQPMADFIDKITNTPTPDLGEYAYPEHNHFAQQLETAIKILTANQDTKLITISTGGLGGWDDHDNAKEYVSRMESLFASLKSAMAHLKTVEKEETINIMVFSEFGRNVNLNASNGWDHGNLQNFYLLGGHGYFKHQGIKGETMVEKTDKINRLYLKPKSDSYWFEPLSIASTLYKIYGIENPEYLTGDYPPIEVF